MALSENPDEFGHPDFILLDDLTEECLLQNLRKRYEKGRVSRPCNDWWALILQLPLSSRPVQTDFEYANACKKTYVGNSLSL